MKTTVFLFIIVFVDRSNNLERNFETSTMPYIEPFVNSKGNTIFYSSEHFKIDCFMTNNIEESFDTFNATATVTSLEIRYCLPPENTSYADVFSSYNFSVPDLKKLYLRYKYKSLITLHSFHFTGLQLLLLRIDNEGLPNFVAFDNDFLQPLRGLDSFTACDVNLPPMTIKVPSIYLINGVSIGEFGECSELKMLYLVAWEIGKDINSWLKSCKELEYLILEKTTLTHIYRILQGAASSIRVLSVTKSELTQFPFDLLEEFVNIEYLDLSHNLLPRITFNEVEHDLGSLKNLTKLDLSHNNFDIGGFNYFMVTGQLASLRELNVSNNPLYDMCYMINRISDGTVHMMPLQKLSLAAIGIQELCFGWNHIPNLEYIDLKNNLITELKIENLPVSEVENLLVDLQGNPIKNVLFERKDYVNLINGFGDTRWTNITFRLDSQFDCDCKHAWFAKALAQQLISVNGAKCIDGKELSLVPAEVLECEKTVMFGCTYRRRWIDDAVTAHCAGANLSTLPQVNKIKELHIANNEIKRIRIEDLPDTLELLDISQNQLSRIETNVSRILFAKLRRVLLGGNPLLCDCENKYFISDLQLHKNQVDDFYNLTCAGGDLLISKVVPDDLCFFFPLHIVLPIAVILALLVLCFIMYRIYEHNIKVFLFIHGLCLYCVQEDDIDGDRRYDAFISFSHHDHDFVTQELIPNLEPDYKICVHYRDWLVGEWIPNQVENSVLLSRKIIVVLSKDYLDSTWGMFEFRMAYANALKEGRTRIIPVVLDDVIDSEMEPDLQNFLANNTYLKWGDPWFWHKLRYALPHKSFGKDKTEVPVHEERRGNVEMRAIGC